MNGREYFNAKLLGQEGHRACVEAMMEKLGEPFAGMLRNYIEWAYDDARLETLNESFDRHMQRYEEAIAVLEGVK